MRNRKAEKRKKKLAERRSYAAEVARRSVYPLFDYDERNGNPDFIKLVKAAVKQFSFDELPRHESSAFKLVRSHGHEYARAIFRKSMEKIREEGGERGEMAPLAEIAWNTNLGQAVFNKMPRDQLLQFIPQNNVTFIPRGRRIVVFFDSLLHARGPGGTVYFSRHRPTLEVDGFSYVVAFSQHAMAQTCERMKVDWTTYAALGDVFAFFSHCVYFERADLYPNQLGFTFYDFCDDPQFAQYWYVLDVLGEENLKPNAGKPYYRIGYCPAVIENEFIKAKTLLFPGYTSTPEYGAVLRSSLAQAEKDAIIAKAIQMNARYIYENNDLSVIRWFHQNGVPQVIQTKRTVYRID